MGKEKRRSGEVEGEVKEILGSCRKLQVTQNLLPIVRILIVRF